MSSSPAGPVILNTGQSSTNEEAQSLHADPYLFDPEAAQGWPVPDPAWKCQSGMTKVRGCGCGNKRIRGHCNKKKCVDQSCKDRTRNRAARAIYDRLMSGLNGRELMQLILTVTPRRRLAASDPKTWGNWTRTLIRWLKKHLGLAFGVERTDPASKCERANAEDDSTCDCSKCRLWHPHINLLWVRASGRGFMQPEEIAAVKAKWRQIIGERPENEVVIHTSYAKASDVEKIWHLCRYIARVWPRWNEQFKRALRVKWIGSYPTMPLRKTDPLVCKKCSCEVVTVSCESEVEAEKVVEYSYQQLLDEREWRRFEAVRCSHDGRAGRIKRRIERDRERKARK